MANITIAVPANIDTDVLNTLSAFWGYAATLADGSPNPQTKAQFVKAHLAQFVKDQYRAAKGQAAGRTATETAEATAATDAAGIA